MWNPEWPDFGNLSPFGQLYKVFDNNCWPKFGDFLPNLRIEVKKFGRLFILTCWSHCVLPTTTFANSNPDQALDHRYLPWLDARRQQCDQMTRIFFIIWLFGIVQNCSKFCQPLHIPSKVCPRFLKVRPSGEILPNLVTLDGSAPMLMRKDDRTVCFRLTSNRLLECCCKILTYIWFFS